VAGDPRAIVLGDRPIDAVDGAIDQRIGTVVFQHDVAVHGELVPQEVCHIGADGLTDTSPVRFLTTLMNCHLV